MDPVGGDEHVGLHLTLLEHTHRVTVRLVDPHQRLPEVERTGAHAIDQGLQQDLLQDASMQGELGPRVPGGEAALLPPDLLAAPGAVDELRRRDRPGAELVEEAQRVELPHGVGQEVDADSERAQFLHRVEDVDLHPDLVEAERRGQATDAGADDRTAGTPATSAHRTSCTSMRTRDWSRLPVETATRWLSQLSRGADVESRTRVLK